MASSIRRDVLVVSNMLAPAPDESRNSDEQLVRRRRTGRVAVNVTTEKPGPSQLNPKERRAAVKNQAMGAPKAPVADKVDERWSRVVDDERPTGTCGSMPQLTNQPSISPVP